MGKDNDEKAKQKTNHDLLAKAKADSKIEQMDIFLAIPDTPENLDVLDSLYTDLAEANIAITVATSRLAPKQPTSGRLKMAKKKLCSKKRFILMISPTTQFGFT